MFSTIKDRPGEEIPIDQISMNCDDIPNLETDTKKYSIT